MGIAQGEKRANSLRQCCSHHANSSRVRCLDPAGGISVKQVTDVDIFELMHGVFHFPFCFLNRDCWLPREGRGPPL